mgnify:CR=1 FL=1
MVRLLKPLVKNGLTSLTLGNYCYIDKYNNNKMEVSAIKSGDREDIELLVFKSSNYYSNYIQTWDEEKVNELFKEDRKSLSFKILNKKKIIGVISYFMIPVLGKYYMEIMVNGNEETFLEAINKFKKVVQKREKIYFLVEKESKKLKNLMNH